MFAFIFKQIRQKLPCSVSALAKICVGKNMGVSRVELGCSNQTISFNTFLKALCLSHILLTWQSIFVFDHETLKEK